MLANARPNASSSPIPANHVMNIKSICRLLTVHPHSSFDWLNHWQNNWLTRFKVLSSVRSLVTSPAWFQFVSQISVYQSCVISDLVGSGSISIWEVTRHWQSLSCKILNSTQLFLSSFWLYKHETCSTFFPALLFYKHGTCSRCCKGTAACQWIKLIMQLGKDKGLHTEQPSCKHFSSRWSRTGSVATTASNELFQQSIPDELEIWVGDRRQVRSRHNGRRRGWRSNSGRGRWEPQPKELRRRKSAW